MLSLWSTLYQINPKYFPKGPDVMIPQDELTDQPKYRILYHKQETLEPELMAESGTPSFYSYHVFKEGIHGVDTLLHHVSLGLCYAT